MLVYGSPQHIRFTAQRHEQLIEMPGTARFAPGSLDTMREPRAKFIAPAAHGFVTHHDAALEQQLFNVAQAGVVVLFVQNLAVASRRAAWSKALRVDDR